MFAPLFIVIFVALFGTVLFVAAGRMDLPWCWAMLGAHWLVLTIGYFLMDPGLRRERIKPGAGGTDRGMRRIAMPFMIAYFVIVGLDVGRLGWSGEVPLAVHVVGFVGYLGGMGIVLWAMTTNRFFSPVVRIQEERGHHLIDTGPYRFVRHPGYAGSLAATICGSLAYGSYWSLLAMAPVLALVLRRLRIEDRFLAEHLEGYGDYAAKVRYAMIPGLL